MKNKMISFFDKFRKTPPKRVAVVRLSGIIAANGRMRNAINLEGVEDLIKMAFKLPKAEAVAFIINSPGGSPVQAAQITQRIRALSEEKDIPVLTFCEDVAASGGYMLALAGDEIYADESSIIGSIGVISAGFGFPEALKKIGIERRVYTAGENKSLLDPFKPEQKEDVEWLRGLQDEIHEHFKTMVRQRRGKRLKGPRAEIFSGAFWTGMGAKKHGLVDGIGEARAVLRDKFGKDVRIRTFSARKPRLFSLFGMGSSVTWSEAAIDRLVDSMEERSVWSRFGL